jgi:osmoprotectant transport system permease protein
VNWDWVASNADELVSATIDHIVLTVIAVGIGFVIAVVLALAVHHDRRTYGPVTSITGVLYTIPSLALFAFLVPLTGLSLVTAEIGLISYTLLILVRNVVAGLDSVQRDVLETADGMGFTPIEKLWRVELPLAVPLIIAGLRIATITTIGLVMVTALIGEGGLGQVMLRGFNFRNWTAVYAAALITLVLAVVFDLLLVVAGRLLTPWARADG